MSEELLGALMTVLGYLVHLVFLVCLVHLVGFDPANKTNETNEINQTDQRNELESFGHDLLPETPDILTARNIAEHQRQIERDDSGEV